MLSNYTQQYDKALSSLKKLDIDKALSIFYLLLKDHPSDYALIRQIYQLELAKPDDAGLEKIANHIFSQPDKSRDFHAIIINIYKELRQRFGSNFSSSLDYQQALNLFYHLGQTTFREDAEALLQRLKTENPEHPALASALFIYCEQLISRKMFLKAKLELEFLMIYYTEARTQIAAEKLYKKVVSGIRY